MGCQKLRIHRQLQSASSPVRIAHHMGKYILKGIQAEFITLRICLGGRQNCSVRSLNLSFDHPLLVRFLTLVVRAVDVGVPQLQIEINQIPDQSQKNSHKTVGNNHIFLTS